MKTLIINAHPNFANQQANSAQLQKAFLQRFRDRFPEDQVDVLNLAATPLPRLTEDELLGMWQRQAAHVTLTPTQARSQQINRQLLDQFKAHQRIVIVTPMLNFNITSQMKDYMDNILVARETFRYTESGSVGLMTDNRRVLLLQSSGSIYTRDDRYTPMEFSRLYLEKLFKTIMGFDDFQIVRVQGTQTQGVDPQAALQQGLADLGPAFEQFYQD